MKTADSLPVVLLRLVIIALFLLPVMFVVLAAFRPPGQPLTSSLIPDGLTLANFHRLFGVLPVVRYTINSLLVVLIAVPLTILFASWAGFAMARLPRPAQSRWVLLSLLVLMVPGVALWSSRFIMYEWMGIGETLITLVMPALMGTSPFYVLMFYRAFRRVSPAIYEAARLDGAGVLATWWRVGLPIVRPTAVAAAVLAFVLYWGDFVSPLIYLGDVNRYTLPVGLQLLEQLGRSDYPMLMAGALWAMLVPVGLVVAVVFMVAATDKMHRKSDNPMMD